jgi:hypothetical protein
MEVVAINLTRPSRRSTDGADETGADGGNTPIHPGRTTHTSYREAKPLLTYTTLTSIHYPALGHL